MEAAAARRKIPCHLPVPFIHGLETEPRGKRYLVFVGEPGDGVFDRVDGHAPAIMAQGTEVIALGGDTTYQRICPPSGPEVVIFEVAVWRRSPDASGERRYSRTLGSAPH